jgi:hypothetical protein
MATGSRTLKLSILGDVSDLNKSLKTANNDVEGFGSKVSDFGKKAGLAFAAAAAAAGAYAIKIGIDGVKAAIEDEAAQVKLAKTLQNVTGATDKQIQATEDYILKTSLAFGVTDTDLRPSLERLSRATKDITEAQKLQTLALDIAAGSGKSLEAVSNALGKAYEGNTGALGKLGVGLSTAELKSMTFDQVTKNLSDTFGGQASANAETYQGRIDRLKVAFDETKESIGAALLPILQTLLKFITDSILPIFTKVSEALNGKEGLTTYFITLGNTVKNIFLPIFDGLRKAFGYIMDAIADNKEAFASFGKFISDYVAPVLGTVLGGALEIVGKIAAGVITIIGKVIEGFTALINGAISGINLLIRAYNAIPFLGNVSEIGGIKMVAPTITPPGSVGSGSTSGGTVVGSIPGGTSSGGSSSSGTSNPNQSNITNIATLQKDFDKNLVAANKALEAANAASARADALIPYSAAELNYRDSFKNSPMNTYNVTVNGALNSEQTARQIITVLNDSQARGTQGASNFNYSMGF